MAPSSDVYLDEEECLGIEVFVNELELLAATGKKAGRINQAELLELLPKLAATITKAQDDKSMIKAMQKRCEPVFTDLISAGVCSTVRRLLCICLSRFYTHGDMLTIYSRVNALQAAVSPKDTSPLPDAVRVCMLEVLAYLALHHGRYLTSAAAENMNIASKTLAKASAGVRVACVHLATATVEGMNSADRTAPTIQAEAWNVYLKASRERGCAETRVAATQLLSAIARSSGAALWRDGGFYWEEALRICNAGLSDPVQAVRDGHAMGLCDLAVSVRLPGIDAAIRDSTRPNAKEALQRLKAEDGAVAYRTAVLQPLVEAALQNRGTVCASLSLACGSYIGFTAAHSGGNPNVLVDLAVQVVLLCDQGSRSLAEAKAQGYVMDTGLGGALAGGEIPHLQACVLYILRAAIIEGLSEAGQKLLVQKLVGLLQRPNCPVPTAVVALEGISILLDVLGEMSDEGMAKEVETAVMSQVSSPSNPVRQLAAQTAAALAAAQPANAAAMLEALLYRVEACMILLTGDRLASRGPLQDAYDLLLGKTQPALMATAHGSALATASTLMAALRLPLSVPGALTRQAYELAVRLIAQQRSEGAASRALEREAGYIILGALISCWGAGTLSLTSFKPVVTPASRAEAPADMPVCPDPASEEILWCLTLALGETATQELDETHYSQAGGESELAMQLWWRSVALQALRTYMGSILNSDRGLVDNAPQQERFLADLLAPVLGMVESQVCMQDPHKAKGGPTGLLAACSATFQLRLLECVQLLNLSGLQPAAQSTLLKICSKPIRAAGMAAAGVGVSMALQAGQPPTGVASSIGYNPAVSAALHRTALQYCLEREDSMLGPWAQGRLRAEEELHDFSGERGAPHNQPWDSPLLTALFLENTHTQLSTTLSSAANGVANGAGAHGPHASHGGARPAAAASSLSADRPRGGLYPQPIGLAPGLVAAQAAVLGRLLCVQSQGVQLQILDDMINAASAGKNRQPIPGDRDHVSRQRAAGTLVSVAALSGLNALMRRGAHTRPTGDQVADKVLRLANALLDGGGSAELGLARAGAQLLAISACIGSDLWAVKVVQALTDEIVKSVADSRDPERRAALCLALGSVHRFKGGLALQALVPQSVGALLAAVKRPSGHAALWALHALALCAASAGAAYLPHVKITLQISQDLLINSEASSGFEIPALRPACARLANSMVGVLGPEFTLGSSYYRMAKSQTTDLVQTGVTAVDDIVALAALNAAPAAGGAGGRAGASAGTPEVSGAPRPVGLESLACELQALLFVQQAILFAPRAVQAAKHVPMLQAKLLSPRPTLRKAAVATLFHLSKRDPSLLLPAHIEGELFAALDSETNAPIASLLRECLRTLMLEGSRHSPAYWLATLVEVVFSSGGGHAANGASDEHSGAAAANGGASGAGGDIADREDDDDDSPAVAAADARRGSSAGQANGVSGGGAAANGVSAANGVAADSAHVVHAALATVALRLRTRLFAAELLLKMVSNGAAVVAVVGSGEGAVVGEKGGDKDTLVKQLPALIDVGYKLATGPTEALRPHGVQLLDTLVKTFSDVEDPLLPGARLLSQYQAQLVSALRLALGPTAAPPLAVAGGRLATSFLESGLVAGDTQVMQRLMDLLTVPLANWGERAPHNATAYAEWVGVQQRVALLRAHAHCAAVAIHGGDEVMTMIVSKAHTPYRSLLASLWTALLQDHAIIATQEPAVRQAYRSALLTAAAPPESLPAGADETTMIRLRRQQAQLEGRELGVFSAEMVEKVCGVYASACPVVLEAVTSHFPSATEVQSSRAKTAAGVTGPTSLWARYSNLLDVGVMLVLDSSKTLVETVNALTRRVSNGGSSGQTTAATLASLGPQVTRLLTCLQGVRKLLDAEYVSAGLAATPVVAGVIRVLTRLAQAALLPMAWFAAATGAAAADPAARAACGAHLASLAHAVADIVKELAQGVSATQFAAVVKDESGKPVALAPVLLDAILATSSVTAPYSVVLPAPPQPPPSPQQQQRGASGGGRRTPPAATPRGGVTPRTSGGGEAQQAPAPRPQYVAAPLVLSQQSATLLDNAAVSLLVAATLLLRKAPAEELQTALQPLLQLTSRLLRTAPAGLQLQAAQRFMGTLLATLAGTAPKLPEPVASVLVTDAWLTLSDLTQHVSTHINTLRHSHHPTTTTHTAANGTHDAAPHQHSATDTDTARCAAIVTALLSSPWHLQQTASTSQPASTNPPDLPEVAMQLVWETVSGLLDVSKDGDNSSKASTQQGATANGHHAPAAQANGATHTAQPGYAQLYTLRRLVAESMRVCVQDATAAVTAAAVKDAATAHGAWARELLRCVGPTFLSTLRTLLTDPQSVVGSAGKHSEGVSGGVVVGLEAGQVVCEGVKVLVGAAALAATQGQEKAQAACVTLLSVMISAATSEPATSALLGPAPRDLAIKLITTLPASPLGEPFKAAVASLPASTKTKLQTAIQTYQETAAAAASPHTQQSQSGAAAAAAPARPTIQLKMNFAA